MPLWQGAVRGGGGAAADRALPLRLLPPADRRSLGDPRGPGLRRSTGFTWSRGAPAVCRSSPAVRGSFCRACGSPLSYESDGLSQRDLPRDRGLRRTRPAAADPTYTWPRRSRGSNSPMACPVSRHRPPAPPRPGISEPTHGLDAPAAVGRLRKPRAGEAGPDRHDPPRGAQTQSASAAAVLGFRTMRPRYMPLFRSTWCGRRSSPESLSST